jgi:hypothetical protein
VTCDDAGSCTYQAEPGFEGMDGFAFEVTDDVADVEPVAVRTAAVVAGFVEITVTAAPAPGPEDPGPGPTDEGVDAGSNSGGSLPSTGTDVAQPVGLALVLLALGRWLQVRARRG